MAMKISDLDLVSIVTAGSPPTACMVVTLIHRVSGQIITLPAVNLGADNFGLRFETHFKGIKSLLEVLGFTVDDVILGDHESEEVHTSFPFVSRD
jgi:hypothetical protein